MKKIIIFIVLGLACLDHLYADGLLVTYELKVKIINYGTSYVQIKWTPRFDLSTGDVHYDSSLTPIPEGHAQYLEQTFSNPLL